MGARQEIDKEHKNETAQLTPMCGDGPVLHQPTDAEIVASPEDQEAIRAKLKTIRSILEPLFRGVYGSEPSARRIRRRLAQIIDRGFDEIVDRCQCGTADRMC